MNKHNAPTINIQSSQLESMIINKEKPLDESYENMIENFDCGHKRYNAVLRRYKSLPITTALLYLHESLELIAYCNYCCSSLKVGKDVFPAVEIKTFSVSKKFQKNSQNDKTKYHINDLNCSDYALRYFIRRIKELTSQMHASYIVLFSDSSNKVISFYKENGFCSVDNKYKFLMSEGNENREQYLCLSLVDKTQVNF